MLTNSKRALALATLAAGLTFPLAQTASAIVVVIVEKSESFDSAASAAANGWTAFRNTTPDHIIGHSATGNASGSAGEAGGQFPLVSSSNWGYYADTSFVAPFSLADPLQASGRIFFGTHNNNHVAFVGFFDAAAAPANNFTQAIGIELQDGHRAQARVLFGVSTTGLEPGLGAVANGAQDFSINYNPAGGASPGTGRLDIMVGATSSTLDNINTGLGLSFNSFGIFGRPHTSSNLTTEGIIFIDSLTYTASVELLVPEPGSMTLLSLGIVGIVSRVRRRKR